MRRLALFCIFLLLAWSEGISAQAASDSTAPLCFRARARPACSAFVLTNFGGYLVLGRDETYGPPLRDVADWGLMANITSRDAIGASVFASLDRLGFALGPAVRYRRWLPSLGSLDIGAGTPLVTTTEDLHPGSLFGLVRWSPNNWFAVAARPELVRRTVFVGCGPSLCTSEVRSRGRMSLGVEFGGVPGLALTGVGGLATALLAAAIAAGSGN